MKHNRSVEGALFNKDESLILTWSGDETARLWNASDGTPASQPMEHASSVRGALFNKDESLILTWTGDRTVHLWNVRDGTLAVQPMKHDVDVQGSMRSKYYDGDDVNGALFNKDESLILTWSDDCTARLWNARDGTPASQPMEHEYRVDGAIFSKDESLILTWSRGGTARLWNARDGTLAFQPMEYKYGVDGAIFNKDGSLILTWSRDGTAHLLGNYKADYDFPKEYLPLLVEVATGTTMDDISIVHSLTTDDWKKRREKYKEIAEEHLKTCKYKEANIYLKQKQFWDGD